MADYLEHSRRWERHPQPARVDYHREGFERPADPEPPTCWRSECRNGCYYPDVCSEKPDGTP